jgi:hypothetical protein
MIYVTLIVSSNGSSDVSSRPLLPEFFDAIFYHQTFWLAVIQK